MHRNTRQILKSAYKLISEIDKNGKFVFEKNPNCILSFKVNTVSEKDDDSNVLVPTIHNSKRLELKNVIIIDVQLFDKYGKSKANARLYRHDKIQK